MKVASNGQVPVGQLLGEDARPRSRWRVALRWRDWNLPLKLGAVTLIPILLAVVLGAFTLTSQFSLAGQYETQHRLARIGEASRSLLDALQRERSLTASALTSGDGLRSPDLRDARDGVDRARTALSTAVSELDERLPHTTETLDEALDSIADVRKRAGSGQLGAVEAIDSYTAATAQLLELDTAVVAGVGAGHLGATADAMHSLLVARDEVSVQQALIDHGIAFGLTPSEFNQVRTANVRRADRVTEFGAAATSPQRALFDDAVRGSEFDEYERIVDAVLSSQDSGNDVFSDTDGRHWNDTAAAVVTAMGEVTDHLGAELSGTTGALADDADTTVGVLAVVLVVSFILAALVVFVIARQLLRSLKVLRNSALEVAQHDLPEAVQAIQEGHTDDTEVNQVPVQTRDEIGEVARAFDVVHSEALRLAAEQAGLRAGYASVFVNLSRRSQSLVQRQLQLIERLERDEEDADQLATLFQLDHLATRMRRNNENLMVLSGAEPARRSGQPISATDVLRAAVSEIEQYQRVSVGAPPPISIVGYAAGDLIRLVAELLDNATAFSAPETQVTVATRRLGDGSVSIEILDKGIGMNAGEVAEANERLRETGEIDLTTSRRMGLFVVGRLAARHGFGVELHGGKDITGVRATVSVPAELVCDQRAPQPTSGLLAARREPAADVARNAAGTTNQAARNGAADAASPPMVPSAGGPLPRRTPGGSARSSQRNQGNAAGEPTANEMTGTALFTPIGWDDAAPGRGTGTHQPGRPDVSGAGTNEGSANALGNNTGNGSGDPAGVGNGVVPGGATTPDWPSEAEAAAQAGPVESEADATEPAENGAGAADRSEPGPREPLSGSKLFEAATSTAVSDWWSAAVTENSARRPTEEQRRARKAAVENAETTPIFDEMVSAWFRKVTDAVGSAPAPDGSWRFAADETFRAVQEVSQRSAPEEYTEAGLPLRRRGERLLPGSAAPNPATPDAGRENGNGLADESVDDSPAPRRPTRDPADVLGRLSSFQKGVSRGRRHRGTEATETSPAQTTDVAASGSGLFTDNSRPSTDSPDDGPVPTPPPDSSERPESAAEAPGESWAFATDERWRTVEEISRSVPGEFTAAGLPRRRRGERLLPGSAAPEDQVEPRHPATRDPADVRGRLASFQQGVRRGRHRTNAETDIADEKVEGE